MKVWVDEYGPIFRMRLLTAHVSVAVNLSHHPACQTFVFSFFLLPCFASLGRLKIFAPSDSRGIRPQGGNRGLADAQNHGQKQAGFGHARHSKPPLIVIAGLSTLSAHYIAHTHTHLCMLDS